MEGAECPRRTGVVGLRGIRYTQRPGCQRDRHLPTRGTKNVAGRAVAWATPAHNPVITHLVCACQLQRPGSTSARGLILATRPTLGSVAGPPQLFSHPPPPPLSQCLSLHQPLILMKLTCHIIADSHNQPMIIVTYYIPGAVLTVFMHFMPLNDLMR